jgi:hypothetical protein
VRNKFKVAGKILKVALTTVLTEHELPALEESLLELGFYKRAVLDDKEALQLEAQHFDGNLIISFKDQSGFKLYALYVLLPELEFLNSDLNRFSCKTKFELMESIRGKVIPEDIKPLVLMTLKSFNLYAFNTCLDRSSLFELQNFNYVSEELDGVVAFEGDPNVWEIYPIEKSTQKKLFQEAS